MAETGSLGPMLQGVSQQPAIIRNDGNVGEQTNMISDVVRGLSSRPGSQLIGINSNPADGFKFLNLTVDGEKLQIGYKANELVILSPNGVTYTLTPDAGTLDYIGDDMQAYTYDDTIYITNRDKIVAMDPDTVPYEAEVITDVGLVSQLGGLFLHTYTVELEYSDGTVATGSYTTPDGTGANDAALTTSNHIISQLVTSLSGHANIKPGTTISGSGPVMMITGHPDIKIVTKDGSGGETMRSQTSKAKSTDDLAEFAPHGALVKVIGLNGTSDDYWMRFEIEDGTVGSGFGKEGLWREWSNSYEPTAFDPATMPHVIEKTGPGQFTLSQGEWQPRRTGDSDTNPEPAFVGKAIRDVSGFQSRLVFIAGQYLHMSRTNIPTDFYKQSVVADIATDPIEVVSTAESKFTLEWIVQFDRDLVIFAEDNQFLVSGSGALTPANASMVRTTDFESTSGVRPVSTGQTLLFPFESGGFAGVKEFFSSNTADANTALSLTDTLDEYMPGVMTNMLSNQNFGIVLGQTDASQRDVFVYQYLLNDSNTEKIQSAWYKWEFPFDVRNIFFDGSEVRILMYDPTEGYIQASLDWDLPDHPLLSYPLKLDVFDEYTVEPPFTTEDDQSYVDLPFDDAVIVQATGCRVPGRIVTSALKFAITGGMWRYFIPEYTAPAGATVVAGLPINTSFKPTMPYIRDRAGKVIKSRKLTVTDFELHFEESGYINARMTSRYRAQPFEMSNRYIQVTPDPDDPAGVGLSDGEWRIPWGERSDWSELEIYSDDVRPMSIIDIEWWGQVSGRGRRL